VRFTGETTVLRDCRFPMRRLVLGFSLSTAKQNCLRLQRADNRGALETVQRQLLSA
jgi:hypothetical protein